MSKGYTLDLSPLERAEKRLRLACRKAIQRAARPVVQRVKQNAEGIKRYGFLAKSIRQKVTIKGSTDNHLLVVGPSMKFSRAVPRVKGQKRQLGKDGKPKRIIPYLYALILSSEKSGKRFRPWLRDAHSACREQYIRDAKRETWSELKSAMR